jgi:hypothetical protein
MHVGVLVLRGARRHEHGGAGGGALRGMHVVEATAERAGGTGRVDMNTAERASVSCAACTLSMPRRSARAAL